jgi:tripeptide aminopeptidase
MQERVLATFLDLVRIDSPTGSEGGVAAYCAEKLRHLGFSVRFDDSAAETGSDTGNLIAELGGSHAGAPVLALSGHMDCVEPCRGVKPRIVDGIIVSAGDTVLGGDDKAGLAAALECFERIIESGEPRPALKALFTVQEEVGLHGAKALDAHDAACDLCLVLDAEGAPGAIVTGAPTHYTFAATFLGKASHAGVAPEQGVSAIAMAADAISKMRLGRLDEATTANVGSVKGGAATNVITAKVDITGECRSLDCDTVEAVKAEMEAAMCGAAKAAGGSVETIWKREYDGFLYPEDDSLVQLVSAAVADTGRAASTYHTGGGSDANVLAGKGVPVLALACGMQGVHGTHEQLAVADLDATAEICVAVARRMVAGR